MLNEVAKSCCNPAKQANKIHKRLSVSELCVLLLPRSQSLTIQPHLSFGVLTQFLVFFFKANQNGRACELACGDLFLVSSFSFSLVGVRTTLSAKLMTPAEQQGGPAAAVWRTADGPAVSQGRPQNSHWPQWFFVLSHRSQSFSNHRSLSFTRNSAHCAKCSSCHHMQTWLHIRLIISSLRRKLLTECCDPRRTFAVTKENSPLGKVLWYDGEFYYSHTVNNETYQLFVQVCGWRCVHVVCLLPPRRSVALSLSWTSLPLCAIWHRCGEGVLTSLLVHNGCKSRKTPCKAGQDYWFSVLHKWSERKEMPNNARVNDTAHSPLICTHVSLKLGFYKLEKDVLANSFPHSSCGKCFLYIVPWLRVCVPARVWGCLCQEAGQN